MADTKDSKVALSAKEPTKQTKPHTLSYLLRDFCDYTSFGGLGRVTGSPFLVLRIIWFLLFLAGLTVAVIQLMLLYDTYQRKPVSTRISLRHEERLTFPTVTVCNFNIVRKSKIAEIPSGLLKEHFAKILNGLPGLPVVRRVRKPRFVGRRGGTQEEEEEDDEGYEDPDQLEDGYKNHEIMSIAIARTRPDDLMPLGHEFEEMVFSCTWRGVNCKKNFTSGKYWTRYWHHRYGNCFVFNPLIGWNGKLRPKLDAYRAGPSHGLKLQLNIEQNDYIDSLTQKAGAVIQISPFGAMPFPEEEGISVAPGFATSIGITKVNIQRVDAFKNGSCAETSTQNYMHNLYRVHFNASYSKTACVLSCLAYNQMAECKCMEYRFPVHEDKVCDTLNKTTLLCLRKVNTLLKANKLNCSRECPSPCKEETYKMTSSFAAWPSLNYQANLVKDLEDMYNFSSSTNGFRDNVLEAQIFYKELNFEVIEETVSYGLTNFVSDVGGQLGLWLGVSVLTGAEVVELILLIFTHVCRRKPRRTKDNENMAENGSSKLDGYGMEPVFKD